MSYPSRLSALFIGVICLLLSLSILPISAIDAAITSSGKVIEKKAIRITLDDLPVRNTIPVLERYGYLFISANWVFPQLGESLPDFQMTYQTKTKRLQIHLNEHEWRFQSAKRSARKDSRTLTMPVASFIYPKNKQLYIPLDFMLEHFSSNIMIDKKKTRIALYSFQSNLVQIEATPTPIVSTPIVSTPIVNTPDVATATPIVNTPSPKPVITQSMAEMKPTRIESKLSKITLKANGIDQINLQATIYDQNGHEWRGNDTIQWLVNDTNYAQTEFRTTRSGTYRIQAYSGNLKGEPIVVEATKVPEPNGIREVSSMNGRLILLNDFPSTHLKNTRTIRVYLPENYTNDSERRYPVLYMQDGQNLFGSGGSFGSWKVDETVDRLVQNQQIDAPIVVGIDNTANRMYEYNLGAGGVVEQYARFVMEELMPYIHRKFRTKLGPEHQAIIGSSFGGNAALYFHLNHADVFSKVGALSPTLAWNEFDLSQKIQQTARTIHENEKLYLYSGDLEKIDQDGDGIANYADWTLDLANQMQRRGWQPGTDLAFWIGEQAAHNEAAWAKVIDQPLLFFFGTEKYPKAENLYVRLSRDQMDNSGIVTKLKAFPIVTYSNGMKTIQPRATWQADEALRGILAQTDQTFQLSKQAPARSVELRFVFEQLSAQKTLAIQSKSTDKAALDLEILAPANGPEKIFMATELTGWNMINGGIWLQRDQQAGIQNGNALYRATLVANINQTIKFKFCAGMEWKFEELTNTGNQTDNRIATLGTSRTTYRGTVSRWKGLP